MGSRLSAKQLRAIFAMLQKKGTLLSTAAKVRGSRLAAAGKSGAVAVATTTKKHAALTPRGHVRRTRLANKAMEILLGSPSHIFFGMEQSMPEANKTLQMYLKYMRQQRKTLRAR